MVVGKKGGGREVESNFCFSNRSGLGRQSSGGREGGGGWGGLVGEQVPGFSQVSSQHDVQQKTHKDISATQFFYFTRQSFNRSIIFTVFFFFPKGRAVVSVRF